MMKESLSILFVIALVSGLAAGGLFDTNKDTEELDKSVDTSNVELGQSWMWEAKVTEKNQRELSKAQPPLQLDNSLERENLRKRYKHLNDRDVVHHVYLFSYGKLIAYHTAQGKVSSVNSKLTQPEQLVPCDRAEGNLNDEECVVSSPQMDGSYGTNGDGIFFFTTDGKYVEWNGEYLVSDQPLDVSTPPVLTREVGSE